MTTYDRWSGGGRCEERNAKIPPNTAHTMDQDIHFRKGHHFISSPDWCGHCGDPNWRTPRTARSCNEILQGDPTTRTYNENLQPKPAGRSCSWDHGRAAIAVCPLAPRLHNVCGLLVKIVRVWPRKVSGSSITLAREHEQHEDSSSALIDTPKCRLLCARTLFSEPFALPRLFTVDAREESQMKRSFIFHCPPTLKHTRISLYCQVFIFSSLHRSSRILSSR